MGMWHLSMPIRSLIVYSLLSTVVAPTEPPSFDDGRNFGQALESEETQPLLARISLNEQPKTLNQSPTSAISLRFADAREFYHELDDKAMQFLFETIPLNTKNVEILGQLVADDTFNIQRPYNQACKLMSKERANLMLLLVKNRKDLEMHLLGPACLSQDIIKARRAILKMWPPSGFPLLTQEFNPANLSTIDVKDILNQSLNQPEWWQSAIWAHGVKWNEINDHQFWRMISPSLHYSRAYTYFYNTLLQSVNHNQLVSKHLEEFLMKIVRMMAFGHEWGQALKNNFDENRLLDKFSLLKDPWSTKVLFFLKSMHSENWKAKYFPEALLKSGLLQFTSWPTDSIDAVTVTNDIFELFIVAFKSPYTEDHKKESIKQAFKSFLAGTPDWPNVRPLVLSGVIQEVLGCPFLDNAMLQNYVDAMLTNPHALTVLQSDLLEHSARLEAYRYNLKLKVRSLKSIFLLRNPFPLTIFVEYIDLLYQEWARDRINWPGLVVAQEWVSAKVRKVFNDSTGDPKTDQDHDWESWRLAFGSIKFDIDHSIPINTIPSMCFLQALSYTYRERFNGWNWSALKKEADENCIFPEEAKEQTNYSKALNQASFWLITPNLSPFAASAKDLQALIRGN